VSRCGRRRRLFRHIVLENGDQTPHLLAKWSRKRELEDKGKYQPGATWLI
jgi:hypothetical protein